VVGTLRPGSARAGREVSLDTLWGAAARRSEEAPHAGQRCAKVRTAAETPPGAESLAGHAWRWACLRPLPNRRGVTAGARSGHRSAAHQAGRVSNLGIDVAQAPCDGAFLLPGTLARGRCPLEATGVAA
jgi:hypothetical protein